MNGDLEKAQKTQKNFTDKCFGVSQFKSLAQAVNRDFEGALNTQKKFCKNADFLTDHVPLVGQCKALINYLAGDKDKASKSWKRSRVPTSLFQLL